MRVKAPCLVVAMFVLLPSAAYAQASITGIVKDSSGGVLPGVTVEASSAVLIEKVRTATTDGNGQYRIVDLRAGEYTVTFTLPGFSTVKREGITLQGAFTATVNIDMRVGASPRPSRSPASRRSSTCRASNARWCSTTSNWLAG